MPDASDRRPAVACALTDAALRARRAEIRSELGAWTIAETRELADGWVILFDPRRGLLDRLARFIEVESACCPFLTFTLQVPENHGRISLTLTGPPGTKESLCGDLDLTRRTP